MDIHPRPSAEGGYWQSSVCEGDNDMQVCSVRTLLWKS